MPLQILCVIFSALWIEIALLSLILLTVKNRFHKRVKWLQFAIKEIKL